MEIPVELAQNYLRRRLEDVSELEKALFKHDFEVCKEIGHRLKGSAKTFGFDDLAELAGQLEEDAQQQNWSSVATHVEHFRIWVDKYIN
jgi:HPt (histidine-containing phosphotransfer) domain-containing protein